ncbi:MAG: GNAT family N-acetyltransferase [Chloroflexota bacterium]|nr:MAG: GNAT family N-acetyltransferase [Chloroflexota bacterium]
MLVRQFRRGDEAGIRAVMDASFDADRMPGATRQEIEVAISRMPADPVGVVVAEEAGEIVGYCAPRFDDLTVHPDHRRQGHGRRLARAAQQLAAEHGLDELTLFVPTHLSGSIEFARAIGLRYSSSLWLFRLPADRAVPEPVLPDGYISHAWPDDIDVEAFVAFANDAWEGHPTPLHLTPELARLVADLPDFDPHGIRFVALENAPGVPVAFAKTELRPDDDGRPIGWIGQIGVLPEHRGVGLGRWLLRWGVAYVRGRGAGTVELAVEAANDRALGLYLRNGFEPAVEWPHWVLPVDALIPASV